MISIKTIIIKLIKHLKFVIVKLFRYLGYDIKKRPQLSDDKSNLTKGYIIEMIGPSGVGKTTLYNKLLKDYEKDWYMRTQIMARVEPSINLIHMKSVYLEDMYSKIFKDKVNRVFSNDYSLDKKYRLTEFFMKELALDAVAKTSLLNKGLFSDDGLTHNFCKEIINVSCSLETEENNIILKKELESFFKSRLIISVTASPEFIIYNLKKRSVEQAKGGNVDSLNDYYNIIGEEHLEEHLKISLENIEKMKKIAEKYGARILTVDVEKEDQEEISEKVFKYTEKLLSYVRNT